MGRGWEIGCPANISFCHAATQPYEQPLVDQQMLKALACRTDWVVLSSPERDAGTRMNCLQMIIPL